jgi:DNA-binding MurR/RpiR family transcriptional regulator
MLGRQYGERNLVHVPIVVPATSCLHGASDRITLSRKQQAIVSYIEHNPKFVAFASAADLARRVGVNPGTVVRLAQLLGYQGFPALQEEIRHRYLASLDAVTILHTHAAQLQGDIVTASIDQDIRNLSATRVGLDRDELGRVADAILRARMTLVTGSGSHGGLAMILAHLCRFMGLPVEAESGGGITLATRLAALVPGDVVIGTSAWWVVAETREALRVAREQGAVTVAIVDNRSSALVKVADHVLVCRTESVSFFQSMIGPLAVTNALVAELAARGGDRCQVPMALSSQMFDRLGVAWPGEETSFDMGKDTQDNTAIVAPVRQNGQRATA